MQTILSEFSLIRVGVVSPELKIADIDFNTDVIITAISKATEKKCFFTVFPELSLTGYTCGDLFFQKILLDKCMDGLISIARHTEYHKTTCIIGMPIYDAGKLFNCAVFISQGQIRGIVPKTYLCNNGEYYEKRWFASETDRINSFIKIENEYIPFGADLLFYNELLPDFKVGLEICEDLWAVIPPSGHYALAGANVICNLSASNEYIGKSDYRRKLVESQSARLNTAYLYSASNANESTSDTVFSGHCLIAEHGKILAETNKFSFNTELTIADIDIALLNSERMKNTSFISAEIEKEFRMISFSLFEETVSKIERHIHKHPFVPSTQSNLNERANEIIEIQSTGLARRLKHINTNTAILGISGGLDSTLALLVTFKAFEKLKLETENIIAVNMPGFGTSERTKSNACLLAEKLNVRLLNLDISQSVIEHFKIIEHNPNEHNIVYENAQARRRTHILMDLANKYNGIVVGTGNLSEIALGWSTFNADHISMYNVNSGVPKTLVKHLINWYADFVFDSPVKDILKDIINTPISPELLPLSDKNEIIQNTEEIIGPYELHDFFLYYGIRFSFEPKKVLFYAKQAFEGTYNENDIKKWLKVFYKRFFSQQFKRNVFPEGPKVGTVALSPRADWRMPADASVAAWLDFDDK